MKPRILIFSTAYYPLVGGAEVAIKEITDRLSDRFDFDLITARINRKYPKIEQIGSVKVYRLGLGTSLDKIWLALFGGAFALKLHLQNPYSLNWAMMASFGGFAASDFKAKVRNVFFLLTLQEGDDLKEIERKVRFVKSKFRNIFGRADYVQCISNYLADWAKKMGTNAPITVIPNGVNLKNYELRMTNDEWGEGIKDQKSKIKIEKKEGEKVIITTSRLVKKNGIEDLIRSLKYLPEGVKLWVLGVGPEEKGLKNLAQSLQVAPRVTWLGFVDNASLFPYLKEADAFVRPSLSEGLGNSFLEAMATGLPTVGTPVGGIVDFLKEGETGWLAEVHSPESIAEKVRYILDPANTETVKRIAKEGQDLVLAKYEWCKIAEKMREIFEKLIV